MYEPKVLNAEASANAVLKGSGFFLTLFQEIAQ
jgi:predicted nucleic acid-binding Zn ribbon protein